MIEISHLNDFIHLSNGKSIACAPNGRIGMQSLVQFLLNCKFEF